MKESLGILEQAINEVSVWKWWAAKLPGLIQVEFGRTQLLTGISDGENPPSTQISLGIKEPASVSFLELASGLPDNWVEEFHNDRLGPFESVELRFNAADEVTSLVTQAQRVITIHGETPDAGSMAATSFLMGFTAGPVGMVILGGELRLVTWAGVLEISEASQLSERWWEYFREYKRRQATDDPLPRDYVCDISMTSDEFLRHVQEGRINPPPEVRAQMERELGIELPAPPSLLQRLLRWAKNL